GNSHRRSELAPSRKSERFHEEYQRERQAFAGTDQRYPRSLEDRGGKNGAPPRRISGFILRRKRGARHAGGPATKEGQTCLRDLTRNRATRRGPDPVQTDT